MAECMGRSEGLLVTDARGAAVRASDEAYVVLKEVTKRFAGVEAVRKVSLSVAKDEFITLLGPSGCGKTTTLRMIGGLEFPDEGQVLIGGEEVGRIPNHRRPTRMVFQSYALFPHMTVEKNVSFGLRMSRMPRDEIKRRVAGMLQRVGLADKMQRIPSQLSGGEQQRVALARALVMEPTVLLLDEPLSALDRQLRKRMQLELKGLQTQLGITFIYVTHDQEEALTMSDRIIVMNQGVVEQIGTPEEIYEQPRTRFVSQFIGETNLLEGVVESVSGNAVQVACAGHRVSGRCSPPNVVTVGQQVTIAVRPEHVSVIDVNSAEGLAGTIVQRMFLGSATRIVVNVDSSLQLIADQLGNIAVQPGDHVQLNWHPEKAVVIPS